MFRMIKARAIQQLQLATDNLYQSSEPIQKFRFESELSLENSAGPRPGVDRRQSYV